MFIYNLIFILTLVGVVSTYKNDNRRNAVNNLFYYILSSIIILVVCLHGENVGPDTHTYMYVSMHPESMTFSRTECILPMIYSILRFIYPNPYFINFIVLLLYQLPIFILINKYSKNRYISLLLYISYSVGLSIFIISMVAMRQALALGFVSLAIIKYCENNNIINTSTIIYLILALLSHTSAGLILPLFLIANIKITKKAYVLILLSSCFIGLSIEHILAPLLSFATLYDKAFYLSGNIQEASLLTLLPFIIPFIVFLYVLPEEHLQNIWIKGMFLAVVMTSILYGVANNLDRICMFYYLLCIVAIPNISHTGSRKNRLISKFMLLAILLYFTRKYYVVLDIVSKIDYPFVPYKTFFE